MHGRHDQVELRVGWAPVLNVVNAGQLGRLVHPQATKVLEGQEDEQGEEDGPRDADEQA